MTTRIAKSSITALALVMLAASPSIASAANAAGAPGGGRGGNGDGSSSSGPDNSGAESDNDWLPRVIRKTEEREPKRKPKRKVVRLFSDNCLWVKKQRPNGSTYAFRYVIECKQKAQQ